jgi:hypothetical protein
MGISFFCELSVMTVPFLNELFESGKMLVENLLLAQLIALSEPGARGSLLKRLCYLEQLIRHKSSDVAKHA